MPRPKLPRQIQASPPALYFKPQGVPLRCLSEVRLSFEGLEAVRLADLQGLSGAAAARRMGISRHTFGRVLAEARRQIAAALVEGQALRIEGGCWVLRQLAAPAPLRRDFINTDQLFKKEEKS